MSIVFNLDNGCVAELQWRSPTLRWVTHSHCWAWWAYCSVKFPTSETQHHNTLLEIERIYLFIYLTIQLHVSIDKENDKYKQNYM